MASSSVSLLPQTLWFRSSSTRHTCHRELSAIATGVSSKKPRGNSTVKSKKNVPVRFHPPPRASSEGIPSENIQDSKFVPLSAEDPKYGPPALLLVGFEAGETDKIQQLLKELDGEFLKVIHCTEDMISLSVWEAVHINQHKLEATKDTEKSAVALWKYDAFKTLRLMEIAKSWPRICILSGLTGEEMMMFIDAFPETGLKPAVFAALVPNSANKLLGEVIEEIMEDHEMLSAKQSR